GSSDSASAVAAAWLLFVGGLFEGGVRQRFHAAYSATQAPETAVSPAAVWWPTVIKTALVASTARNAARSSQSRPAPERGTFHTGSPSSRGSEASAVS